MALEGAGFEASIPLVRSQTREGVDAGIKGLQTPCWREMDSNPRSPVGETDVWHPVRPLQNKKRRVIEHGGGTAVREITLLTGGYGMSRVPSSDIMLADQRQDLIQ